MSSLANKQWKGCLKRILFALPLLLLVACIANLETALDEDPPAGLTARPDAGDFDAPAVLPGEPPTPVPSPGQVFYIAPNGSDGDDGSSTTPWLTIQHAVDNVAPGDTILLRSGTYAGARIEQSGTAAAWITLATAPGAAALINAAGPNNKHDSILEFETWEGDETVAYWLVEGLEVAAAPNWGIDLRGLEGNHSHDFINRRRQ